jgi:hypothetical protein
MAESDWWYLFDKETKKRDSIEPGLDFGSFEFQNESGMFKCNSWLKGLFFGLMNGVS